MSDALTMSSAQMGEGTLAMSSAKVDGRGDTEQPARLPYSTHGVPPARSA